MAGIGSEGCIFPGDLVRPADKARVFCSTSSIQFTIAARSGTAGFDSAPEFWEYADKTVIKSAKTTSILGGDGDMAIFSAVVS